MFIVFWQNQNNVKIFSWILAILTHQKHVFSDKRILMTSQQSFSLFRQEFSNFLWECKGCESLELSVHCATVPCPRNMLEILEFLALLYVQRKSHYSLPDKTLTLLPANLVFLRPNFFQLKIWKPQVDPHICSFLHLFSLLGLNKGSL